MPKSTPNCQKSEAADKKKQDSNEQTNQYWQMVSVAQGHLNTWGSYLCVVVLERLDLNSRVPTIDYTGLPYIPLLTYIAYPSRLERIELFQTHISNSI